MKYNLSRRQESFLYPYSYKIFYFLSLLRWVVLVYLFFLDWRIGLVCLVIVYILTIIIPEQDDYKNLQRAKRALERKLRDSDEKEKEVLRDLQWLVNDTIFQIDKEDKSDDKSICP